MISSSGFFVRDLPCGENTVNTKLLLNFNMDGQKTFSFHGFEAKCNDSWIPGFGAGSGPYTSTVEFKYK